MPHKFVPTKLLTWVRSDFPYQGACSSSPHKASLQILLTLELESVESEYFQLTVATGHIFILKIANWYFHFYYWVSYNTRGDTWAWNSWDYDPSFVDQKTCMLWLRLSYMRSSNKKEFKSAIFERFLPDTWILCCTELSYLLSCLHESEFQQRTWLDPQSIISWNEQVGINHLYSSGASLIILVKRIKTLIRLDCRLPIVWTEVYEIYSRGVLYNIELCIIIRRS